MRLITLHTKECAQTCVTQNNSIVVRGEHNTSTIEYYSELTNILELRCLDPNRKKMNKALVMRYTKNMNLLGVMPLLKKKKSKTPLCYVETG